MSDGKPQIPDFIDLFKEFHERLQTSEIGFAEWDDRFGAVHTEVLDLDSPIVRAVDPHFVWTECSDFAGGWIALPGFEIVNRSGYWLSELPWTDGDQFVVRIAEPSEDEEDEEGRPWSEHVLDEAHKRLRHLLQVVVAAGATAYTDCGIDPRDAEHFRNELQRTGTEIGKMIARLHRPAQET